MVALMDPLEPDTVRGNPTATSDRRLAGSWDTSFLAGLSPSLIAKRLIILSRSITIFLFLYYTGGPILSIVKTQLNSTGQKTRKHIPARRVVAKIYCFLSTKVTKSRRFHCFVLTLFLLGPLKWGCATTPIQVVSKSNKEKRLLP